MDLWTVLDHPVLFTVGFFVIGIGISLAWAMFRIAYVRARSGPEAGVDVAAIAAAWKKRPLASEAVDVAQLQSMIQEAFLSGQGAEVTGDTKDARIANLEGLHAAGQITAEKLAELKAAIAAEG